jgi:hypothetical protein
MIRPTAVPFNIVTLGTYQLTGDLSFPSVIGTAAINILGGLTGPIVLDLEGFTGEKRARDPV